MLLRQGHPEAAEDLYRKALGIAREQEAKMWELRAAMSLAQLFCDRGRRAEARDLLAPVYAWFTEGFATPHLKEAKALLEDLTCAGDAYLDPADMSVRGRIVIPHPPISEPTSLGSSAE